MPDNDILSRIKNLVDEEHSLAGDSETADERIERRKEIEAQLDQCWDLLRQRQARRDAGQDPAGAEPRPLSQVETYLQ